MYKIATTNINGDQLGSQMNSFAMLYLLSNKLSSHSIAVLSSELNSKPYGQNLFLNGFDAPVEIIEPSEFYTSDVKIIPLYSLTVDQKIPIDKISQILNEPGNCVFKGLFHATFMYFLDHLKDLTNNFFKFKEEHINNATKWLDLNKSSTKKHISVHVRRTDFLACAAAVCSNDYYIRALAQFDPADYKLFVFSDDIDFCMEYKDILFKNYELSFSKNNTQYVDMYLMTQCDINIIANSCFSMWGALLNKPTNLMVYPTPMLPSYMNFSKLLAPYKNHSFVENPYNSINY